MCRISDLPQNEALPQKRKAPFQLFAPKFQLRYNCALGLSRPDKLLVTSLALAVGGRQRRRRRRTPRAAHPARPRGKSSLVEPL